MSEQLVSIIMPSYNAEKYLRRSINSVIAQTYSNWELLIVDDGSTDSSKAICEEYCAHDHRIKLIYNQHGGTALARNTALDIARGEYFAFLDADDVYHSCYLEMMIRAIENSASDMAICQFERGVSSNEFLSKRVTGEYQITDSDHAFRAMYQGKWHLFSSHCNKIYARSVFESIRFPVGRCFEDVATVHLAMFLAARICIMEEPFYYYYVTQGSSSKTNISTELLDREIALRSHWEYYIRMKRMDLAYLAIPFYLSELIVTYYRIRQSDKPEDCRVIRAYFDKVYRKYIRKINPTDIQRENYFAFRYPHLFDIRNMVRRDGVMRSAMGFIKRKLG